jgi:hypothetical protein
VTIFSRGVGARMAALVLVAGAALVAPTTPAQATTGEMHMCTHDEINNGKVMRSITLEHRNFEMTHAERKRIPRGVSFDHSVTMAKVTVLKASFSATATVKADAGAFFAKASVEASATVGGEGSRTTSQSVTDTFHVPKAKRQRVYVFYAGNDYFRMRAHKRMCNRQGQQDYYGRLKTFNKVVETGAVLCPHSRYRQGSINYQVTLGAGC